MSVPGLLRPWSPEEGGGGLGSNHARICVFKSEGHGSFFRFKGVK